MNIKLYILKQRQRKIDTYIYVHRRFNKTVDRLLTNESESMIQQSIFFLSFFHLFGEKENIWVKFY